MMRRTPVANYHHKILQMVAARGRYNNVCEQPYYLKPVAENPYLGTQHDGTSTEYKTGFTVKPIHHLYRFTHNYLPENIPRQHGQSPKCKRVHWMEMTIPHQAKTTYLVFEIIPPLLLTVLILAYTIWHLWRCALYHPDITWYNLAFPTNKAFVQYLRTNQKMHLDQPVYRYMQQQTEFYFKDGHMRANLEFDLVVNDPYIQHVKEIGRGDELTIHLRENAGNKLGGSSGRGHLVPQVFEEKSSWYTPYKERVAQNPDKAFAENVGSSTFWSLYTNLWRGP